MKPIKNDKTFRPDRVLSYFRVEWLPLAFVTLSGLVYNIGLLATPWFEGRLAQCLADILGGSETAANMALLVLALRQSEPYAPDAQTAAFAHLNRLAAWAARWLPMGTAWLLVLGGVLFCASLARSAAQAAHYTVWRTDTQLGSRGGLVRRYELRIRLRHLSFADVRRSPATWALHYSPVYVTASRCQPEVPLLVWREGSPFLQQLLPGFAGAAVLDADGLNAAAQLLAEGKPLLVYEEVAGIGGLGSLLQQVAAGQESRTPVHSLALPDRWIYHGKRRELLRRMELDAAGLRKTVRELLGR